MFCSTVSFIAGDVKVFTVELGSTKKGFVIVFQIHLRKMYWKYFDVYLTASLVLRETLTGISSLNSLCLYVYKLPFKIYTQVCSVVLVNYNYTKTSFSKAL